MRLLRSAAFSEVYPAEGKERVCVCVCGKKRNPRLVLSRSRLLFHLPVVGASLRLLLVRLPVSLDCLFCSSLMMRRERERNPAFHSLQIPLVCSLAFFFFFTHTHTHTHTHTYIHMHGSFSAFHTHSLFFSFSLSTLPHTSALFGFPSFRSLLALTSAPSRPCDSTDVDETRQRSRTNAGIDGGNGASNVCESLGAERKDMRRPLLFFAFNLSPCHAHTHTHICHTHICHTHTNSYSHSRFTHTKHSFSLFLLFPYLFSLLS